MKTIVMIPTWNEKENIKRITPEILKHNVEILVVDDNSPDKTWQIILDFSKKNKKVHLLLRKHNKGRGTAGRDGFKKALVLGADYIIEMDADFSHDPKYIPKMLEEIKNYDVVLGSRSVEGAKDLDRDIFRRFITFLGNSYIRLILGLKVRDCNSGFRCFRRKVLLSINLNKLKAKGPDIVQEVLYKVHLKGFKIKEIPIIFPDRKYGKTTKTLYDYIKAPHIVLKLRFDHLMGKF